MTKFITKNGKKIPMGNRGDSDGMPLREVSLKDERKELVDANKRGVGTPFTNENNKRIKEIDAIILRDKKNKSNKRSDEKISDAKVPYEERRIEVRAGTIEDIDDTNREIDSTGSKMIGGIDPLNKEGVTKMVNHSRKVGTLIGDLFD